MIQLLSYLSRFVRSHHILTFRSLLHVHGITKQYVRKQTLTFVLTIGVFALALSKPPIQHGDKLDENSLPRCTFVLHKLHTIALRWLMTGTWSSEIQINMKTWNYTYFIINNHSLTPCFIQTKVSLSWASFNNTEVPIEFPMWLRFNCDNVTMVLKRFSIMNRKQM